MRAVEPWKKKMYELLYYIYTNIYSVKLCLRSANQSSYF